MYTKSKSYYELEKLIYLRKNVSIQGGTILVIT